MTVANRSGRPTSPVLFYELLGAGEPLVIHGLGSVRHVWNPVMTRLTNRYDVIRVDLLGHGSSPRLSLGGWVALELAHAGPAISATARATLAATHHRRCNAEDIDAAVPVTVVWEDRDRILPTRNCQESAGLPPHACRVRLSRCGHVPRWDQPAAATLFEETVAAAAQLWLASSAATKA